MDIDATTPQPGEVASPNPEVTAPESTPNPEPQVQTPAPVEQVETPAQVVTGSNDTSNLEAKRRASEMYLRRENRRLKEQLERASQPQSAPIPQAQQTQRIGLFEDPDKFMAQHDEELANRILAGLEQRETAKMSAQKEQEAHKILEQLSSEGQLERVQEIIAENPALDNLDTLSAVQIVQKMIGVSKPVERQIHALTPRKSLSGITGGGTSNVGTVSPSFSELKAKVARLQEQFGTRSKDPEFMKEWNQTQSELKKIHTSGN
jgi:hypothetical protein